MQSLILKEQSEIEAAPFFPDFDLPQIDKTKPKFHCTGERLFRDRNDVYKAVVRLLAEPGVTIRTICNTLHVTDDVVRSVKARENIPIAHQKKEVLYSITHGLRLASERVIELMPAASTRDALIGVGILGEKMQLLGGDATQKIDITVHDGRNIYDELHDLNRRALEVIEAEIVPQTGINGGNVEQKALPVTSGVNDGCGRMASTSSKQMALAEPAELQEAAL